jgi:hypothetical protein
MTAPICGAGRILHGAGPVAVPFRSCCAAALLATLSDAASASGSALRSGGNAARDGLSSAPRGGAGPGVGCPPCPPCAVSGPTGTGPLPGGAEPPVAVGKT